VRKQKHERVCLNCGGEITDLRKSTKFCGSHCQREYEYKQYILRWKSGECSGNRGVGQLSQFVRRYMLEKTNCSCEICGCNWVNPKSGRPIVEIHHIDGDANNSKEENLQVLCPNHHAMTVNYSALNTGKSTRTKRKTNSEGDASPNKLEK
jgi:hypothetical protein